ncbi:hypothetical protein Gpo141_00012635 [Globisporangium polare]
MSDLDEEMKTGEVHTDDGVVRVSAYQQPLSTTVAAAQPQATATDAAADPDEASRHYPHIAHADHVGEQQQAPTPPHIQSGCWRATRDAAHGASVLLTTHARDQVTATVTAPAAVYERLVQSHPHLVILYGTHDHVFVCEDGKRFHDFVVGADNYKRVLHVFYGVLLGLRFMHERGLVHGSVNAQHIVVGVNKKGKLLTRFPISGQQPESEPLAGKSFDKDEQQQQQFRADEDAFVCCMKFEVKELLDRLNRGDIINEGANRKVFVQVLEEAKDLLDEITPDRKEGIAAIGDVPRLHLRRATERIKKLVDREAEACTCTVAA